MAEVRYVQLRLDPDLADWFDVYCPGLSKQAFGEECFRMLQALIVSGELPPTQVYSAKAALRAAANFFTEEVPDGPSPLRPESETT